ncbi:MAG TPA: alpha/beta hydrolase [Rummeliibacillus sp.]|nr:alpha/beta hydrolase [Rummeliibacillus sp.]
MQHIFVKGTDDLAPTLLLLHGTGGNERDLIELGKEIDPTASLLGVRGSEIENGMPRFFKRLAEGLFDLDNLDIRTKELATFIDEASIEHGFNRENVVAVGYSNGANIAANLFFQIGKVVKGAILHHPMIPRDDVEIPDLTGLNIWIGAGQNDRMCPIEQSTGLKDLLEAAGANVSIYWHQYGHQLTMDEVHSAANCYRKNIR